MPAAPTGHRILVVDDELGMCLGMERALSKAGHRVEHRQDPVIGLEEARQGAYDLIVLDLAMPGMTGIELLDALRRDGVESAVVVVSGHGTVETAVAAMKLGAADFLSKPFTPDSLRHVVSRVLERSDLIRENAALRRRLARQGGFEGMLGQSAPMERVFRIIERVAPTDGTVLITGESGTGKELVAEAVHRLSARRARPFLAADCSALAEGVLESELFGHVKGAFSGAVAQREGLFEAADGGTLFLDEVSNLSWSTQGKLLRVLESRKVKRVGDARERPVDIRLVAATNKDLAEQVRKGDFREDLLYRLDVVPIRLPPLRERRGDVPLLAGAFLDRARERNPLTALQRIGPEAMAMLEAYPWPGNVRELKNTMERVAILADGPSLEPVHLPERLQRGEDVASEPLPATWEAFMDYRRRSQEALTARLERRFLGEALRRAEGNVSRAAREVGMQRTHLHALLRKHGLR